MAKTYLANNQFSEAERSLLILQSENPLSDSINFELARLFFFKNEYKKAKTYIKHAIEQGENVENRYKLLAAEICEADGNIKEAIEIYKQILQLDPHNKISLDSIERLE